MFKKLACVGLGAMLVITLSGCGKENKSNNDTDVFNDIESKQEELKDDVNEPEELVVKAEESNTKEENSKANNLIASTTETVYMEENAIKDKLGQYTNNTIKDMIVDDFNNDGYSEAFVFTARELSEEEIAKHLDYLGFLEYTGEVWFINSKGKIKEVCEGVSLQECDEEIIKAINIGSKKCVFAIEYTNGGDYTYVWSVSENGNDFITVFNDRIHLTFNKDGTIYTNVQKADAYYNADMNFVNGWSFKEYYFYICDDQIKEYGAINISLDKLKEFDGSEEIIDNITKDGEVITEILYRENNIININTMKDSKEGSKAFLNYTLKYDENKTVKDITSEKNNGETSGNYKKAIKPDCATYPTISLRPSNTVSKERIEFLYNSRLSEWEGEFLTPEEYEAFTEDDKVFLNLCSIFEPIADEVYAQGIYKYEASSTYSDEKIDYSAKNLEDLFNGQSWVEGSDGFGIGEKIKVTMAPWSEHTITEREEIKTPEKACEVVVKYKEKGANDGTIKSYECIYNELDNIYIINGYAKNDELWKANSRVKKMKLTIDNKEEYILELNDTNQLQVFDVHYKNDGISKPIVAEFEILEVYKGDKYEDTAMSFLYSYVSPNDINWSAR